MSAAPLYDVPDGTVVYRYGGAARLVEGSRSEEPGIDFRPDLVDRNFELRSTSAKPRWRIEKRQQPRCARILRTCERM